MPVNEDSEQIFPKRLTVNRSYARGLMKKHNKTALGVTLLEVMLTLAVAAMIIVMSIRYYQSATSNQQTNLTP